MWKPEVSLKATLLPPACLDPPSLRVVPAPSIVQSSPAPLGLLSAPFSVSIRCLLSGPRHVVSTGTQISLRRAWGTRGTFRSCAAPSRARAHVRGALAPQTAAVPGQGLQLGFGVAAVGKVQVPIPQRVRVSLGAVCPAERSRGLLALLSLAMSFPPLLVLSIL